MVVPLKSARARQDCVGWLGPDLSKSIQCDGPDLSESYAITLLGTTQLSSREDGCD